MTDPRRLFLGQTHTVSRRTRDRRGLLAPTDEVNQIVLYSLGRAQEETGVAIHAFTTVVTHHHQFVTDTRDRSRLPEFYGRLHSLTARALNAHFGTSENFWRSPGSYGNVEVHEAEAAKRQLFYVWAQPVKDGLVRTLAEWGGVHFGPEDLGRTIKVKKPPGFFGGRRPQDWEPTYGPARKAFRQAKRRREREERRRRKARGAARGQTGRRHRHLERERERKKRPPRPPRRRETLPDEVEVTISVPPCFAHLPIEEVRAVLRQDFDAHLAELHAEREAEGRTEFMGMAAILARDPRASVGDSDPTFELNPTISGRDRERRIQRIDHLQAFRRQHKAAVEAWRAGDREVVFPYGSYAMPHFHGANVERPPPLP